ncbi:MAG: hypothetical protein V4480_02970 [Patescibacteria group bacterium]
MKSTRTLTAVTLAAGIALTPFLALAHDANLDSASAVQVKFNEGQNSDDASVHADTNVSADGQGLTGRPTRDHANLVPEGVMMNKDHGNAKGDKGAGMMERGDTGIDMRIGALEKLSSRIEGAKRVSGSIRSELSGELSAQIQALTSLKAKIGNDASTSTLRADVKGIRPEFRTYALVLPQAAITAASDRVLNISAQMDAFGAKLNSRIQAATTAGTDTTAAVSAYNDYTAKVADAKVQANAAASLIAGLKPDNGDKAVFAANSAALKSAHDKLKVAETDLKAARVDIGTILKTVKGASAEAHASTTVKTHS